MADSMHYQETEGFLSPFIRNQRLARVASFVAANSTVLDLACGAGHLSRYLPTGCTYYGIDRVRLSPALNFIVLDLLDADAPARLAALLPVTPDYITCVAFLEHLLRPSEFLARIRTLLNGRGQIIGTTPHPRGRQLHDALSKIRLLSRSASEEHQAFLGKEALEAGARASGGRLVHYEQFLLGFNQLFIIQYD